MAIDDTLPGREADARTAASQTPPGDARLHDGALLEPRDEGADAALFDRALSKHEHATAVARMRRLSLVGCGLWCAFALVDWQLATFSAPGELAHFLSVRAIALAPLLLCAWRLRRAPEPDAKLLRVLDGCMSATCSAALTVICVSSGGLASPYASYIALVMIGRASALSSHWRQGAVQLGVPVLVHPIVLALAVAFDPALAAQLRDRSAATLAFFYEMLLAAAWLLLVVGGHNVWSLRRHLARTRSIGRYRLIRRIGHGGMGEVWVAYHESMGREVALKLLRPDFGTDRVKVARFNREVRTTARLTHPNTVHIFEHGATDEGLWYYAMELLEGDDLAALVRREGALECGRAVRLVRDAARALAEAHALGIVHRDVKPENIFVAKIAGEDDVVKVLDFGIARTADARDTGLSGSDWLLGTPAYASPEALRGDPVGPRADVYGLGMVLYWALTGGLPFGDGSAFELLARRLDDAVPPPSLTLGRALPEAVERVVMRCLARDPSERYADAGELASALGEALAAASSQP